MLKAECIDENDKRTDDAEPFREFNLISIGDLANAVRSDINGDEQCLLLAHKWFDYLILGNHESGWIFPGITFNGFVPTPHLKALYNAYYRDGLVVPAVLVGETLLTHAGVQEYYDFNSAQEAWDAIDDVWWNYTSYREDYDQRLIFDNGRTEIPKALLLDGVPKERGGSTPMGGILWSDWREQKNRKFSQVVGHTPQPGDGPVLHEYKGTGVFHLNIDCGGKGGLPPVGVWLDEDGQIDEFVQAD